MTIDRFFPPTSADFDGSIAQSLLGWAPALVVALALAAGIAIGWVLARRSARRSVPRD